MNKKLLVLFVGVIIFTRIPHFGQENIPLSFKVIVSSTIPIKSITSERLSKIYLKKISLWKNNTKIYPCELNYESPIRKEFTNKILKKRLSVIKAYWRKKIFSGRGVPPLVMRSDQEIINYVIQNPGSIGYISKSTPISATDKINVVEILLNSH